MKLITKFLLLMGVLFTGILWGVNTVEDRIQTIQGTNDSQVQQAVHITRIENGKVNVEASGTKIEQSPALWGDGNSNWLSSLGNGLRSQIITLTRSTYLWLLKQL